MSQVPTTLSEYGFKAPVDEIFASKLIAGLSVAQAARECEITPASAYAKRNHPDFVKAFRKYMNDVLTDTALIKSRIELGATAALDKLLDTLQTSMDEKVITTIGFGLLDRAGHSVKQQHEVTKTIRIAPEDAEALERAFGETIEVGHTSEHGDKDPAPRLLEKPTGNGQASHPKEPG